jgi:hypothetical protein
METRLKELDMIIGSVRDEGLRELRCIGGHMREIWSWASLWSPSVALWMRDEHGKARKTYSWASVETQQRT